MKTLICLVATAGLLLAGCGGSAGTNSGTSSAGSDITNGLNLPTGTNAILSVRTSTSQSSAQALTIEVDAQSIEIDTALVGLKNVKLKTFETSDSEAADFELAGPFIVDLIAGTVENCGTSKIDDDADDDGIEDSQDSDDDNDGIADSEDSDDDDDGIDDSDDSVMDENMIFDALTLPAGTYKSIKARIDDVTVADCPEAADSPLIGNTMYIAGTVDGVPFVFTEEFDTDLEVEDPVGIVVDDTSIASFILTFNIAAWFEGINFSSATVNGDGVIVLDKDNNESLQDQLKQNVENNAELENDEDGDGTPDSDDDDS